ACGKCTTTIIAAIVTCLNTTILFMCKAPNTTNIDCNAWDTDSTDCLTHITKVNTTHTHTHTHPHTHTHTRDNAVVLIPASTTHPLDQGHKRFYHRPTGTRIIALN